MKRVVVTGMGIVSSIGNNKKEVLESLREGKSGIRFSPEYQELGFRSHVFGPIQLQPEEYIDRKYIRFMGDASAYTFLALKEAIADANLESNMISNFRTGLIVGSGGCSNKNMHTALEILRDKGARKVGPTMVPRIMASGNSASLAVAFQIKGINYSISSACATSTHCIGNAYENIQLGKQDIIFAGGSDEVHWTSTLLFDAMGALSSSYNETPGTASRPFDAKRDGFVISGGGGIIVLEELDHARSRGANIYAELVGYGATSDGFDMVKPSGEGAIRCMQMALAAVNKPVDYINAHATSTPAGDIAEINSIKTVFGERIPLISSTKALTGHGLGAAGVNESIFSLLMMKYNFISASANIFEPDEGIKGVPIATQRIDNAGIDTVMSNSFGFGGTNASLVFQRPD
jgi:3-oxoacyl-[acyl-carrier-protein] synthase I